jgi:hypothetical protein
MVTATLEVDPVERRGLQERLQAHLGRCEKLPAYQFARLGLARRIGQGGGDTANKASVLLEDIDLHAHETPALHARAIGCERGSWLGHSHAS